MRLLVILCLLVPWIPAMGNLDNLMPLPKCVETRKGDGFKTGQEVRVTGFCNSLEMHEFISEAHFNLSVKAKKTINISVGDVAGAEDYELRGFPNEAYRLEISRDSINIIAPEEIGVTRAFQTLRQIVADNRSCLPNAVITDWPSFKLRGFMHDIGRSFLPFEELKREIDLLSRFKVNVFHWHLTDNTGWRLEINKYPELTSDSTSTRYPGCFYTQAQARELQQFAMERGMQIIPEIDLPGHSAPFTKAFGHTMLSDDGKKKLKEILMETVEVFNLSPYIHIGGDEIPFPDDYLVEMIDYVHSLGKKVVVWNRYNRPARLVTLSAIPCDMTTNWATSGTLVNGIPNIDMRYNYTNHFDLFADVVGIFKSSVFGVVKGNPDVAGTISAAWNDTMTPGWEHIVRQNNIYANILASCERAWRGGGKQYIENGGTALPTSGEEFSEFADWERRFIHHKNTTLVSTSELIPYVKQSHVRWCVTDPIPNGGDPSAVLPPEKYIGSEDMPASFPHEGKEYGIREARGAGIYLRHIWHPIVKGIYENPHKGHTAYAWTYVYTPRAIEAGALIEFYTYSRSGNEKSPESGCWDRRGSRIWINGEEIPAPEWSNPGRDIVQDANGAGLTDENASARRPVALSLRKGWNKVFLKLPYADNGGTGRDKWQFTFVLTDPEGRNALEGLEYRPSK